MAEDRADFKMTPEQRQLSEQRRRTTIKVGFPWRSAQAFFREERNFVRLRDIFPGLRYTLADVNALPQMGGEPATHETNPLVVLLYLLMRDEVTPGAIEGRVHELECSANAELLEAANSLAPRGDGLGWSLTNSYLAGYARNIVRRLGQAEQESRAALEERLRQGENHIAALLRAPSMSETDRLTDRSAAKVWLGADPAEAKGRDPRDPGQYERRG